MPGKIIRILLIIIMAYTMSACSAIDVSDKKVSQIDYTVVTEDDLPDTLKSAIEEKKNEPFKLS